MNNALKNNKTKLDQIKENNQKLRSTLGQKLKDNMDRNILNLKQINNQICSVSKGLEAYTEELRYFSGIAGQLEKFCDFYRQGNIPNYQIPSENVQRVIARMGERFLSVTKNIDLLKDLVASESASGIPQNQMQ